MKNTREKTDIQRKEEKCEKSYLLYGRLKLGDAKLFTKKDEMRRICVLYLYTRTTCICIEIFHAVYIRRGTSGLPELKEKGD